MLFRSILSLCVCAMLLPAVVRAQEGAEPAPAADRAAEVLPEEEAAAEDEPEAPAPEPEPEVVRYRDPAKAMAARLAHAVEIEISPRWKLTEEQLVTATRAPQVKEGSKPVRYIYPEDRQPTEEEKANGSALTDNQRYAMKRARKRARQEACWQAFLEADRYNKEHDEELTLMEKQGKHIIINLKKQQGFFMDGDKVLLKFSVCTGRRDKPTPTGHFHVLDKDRNHRSNLYNNANMPFFMRLTMGGVGLHQGRLAGYPASHGCIRLSEKTARYLFSQCEVGTPVFVQ